MSDEKPKPYTPDEIELVRWRAEEDARTIRNANPVILRLLATLDERDRELERERVRIADRDALLAGRAEALSAEVATVARLRAEVDYLKRREAAIIEALGGVADGGRYVNDIVGKIEQVRREARRAAEDMRKAAKKEADDRAVVFDGATEIDAAAAARAMMIAAAIDVLPLPEAAPDARDELCADIIADRSDVLREADRMRAFLARKGLLLEYQDHCDGITAGG